MSDSSLTWFWSLLTCTAGGLIAGHTISRFHQIPNVASQTSRCGLTFTTTHLSQTTARMVVTVAWEWVTGQTLASACQTQVYLRLRNSALAKMVQVRKLHNIQAFLVVCYMAMYCSQCIESEWIQWSNTTSDSVLTVAVRVKENWFFSLSEARVQPATN